MRIAFALLAALLAGACAAPAPAPAEKPLSAAAERGRSLYATACAECHTTQAHWREKRLVQTWPDLVHQVNRWQGLVGQGWERRQVEDVAAYLNERFYGLP